MILCAVSAISLCASEPSKFVEKSRFYAQDFEHKDGMKTITYRTDIGIVDDEVFIGRPRVYVNDSIVLCNCEREAVTIKFKKGELYAYCEEHCTKHEPVNSQLKAKETERRIKAKKENSAVPEAKDNKHSKK